MNTLTSWNIFQKIGFRFLFVFFLLMIIPFPLNTFDFLNDFTLWFDRVTWQNLVPFVSESMFDIPGDSLVLPRGSGDTTYNYIQLLCFAIISGIATVIWSILDRKRANYSILLRFFIALITYYLMYFMFLYGFIKVFKLQFSDPRLTRLLQPYGDSSPMGIAWTYMGASTLYTFFAGASEVIGGLLLIFKRTRTLGALVCFGVMLNVFMMNMSYDIPVKIFSFQLMLTAIIIALYDGKRLLNLFLLNTATASREFIGYFKNPKLNKAAFVVKILLVGFFLYSQFSSSRNRYKSLAAYQPENIPLYGIHEVTNFVKNNDTIPPLKTDTIRWDKVVIQSTRYSIFYDLKGDRKRYGLKLDTVAKTISFPPYKGNDPHGYEFNYTFKDSILTLQGMHGKDSLWIELKQYDHSKFKLTNRGFHWINETPYNR